jgi:hypothetical protein
VMSATASVMGPPYGPSAFLKKFCNINGIW